MDSISRIGFELAALGISPKPDIELYEKRRELLREFYLAPKELPRPLPDSAGGPSVWGASEIELGELTLVLSASDVEEIENAVSQFKASEAHLDDLSPYTFLLPTIGQRLCDLSLEIHAGRGIGIIRGLEPEKYSMEENVMIYAGLASYIASMRGAQSGDNDFIFHVMPRDDEEISDLRPSASSDDLPFHTDGCDVVGQYVVETAATGAGGDMFWTSTGTVYNELATTRPELLPVFTEAEWPFQTSADPPSARLLPLLHVDPRTNMPYFWFSRLNFTGTVRKPRPDSIPSLRPDQADALDALQFTAARNARRVTPQKGDIYFLNNFNIIHARQGFTRSRGEPRRHLIRLWLRDSVLGREIPEPLKHRWLETFDNAAKKRGRWAIESQHEVRLLSERLYDKTFGDETTGSSK